ncbi:MAG: RNA methyltransferase [Flavobacteriales bacterium]|nr:RNA methyltransferase [Flavobacteriales bacterium]
MEDHDLYERLAAFITPHRRSLFDRIAPLRTRHVTVVLEDIHLSQNASAVVRTADLLGVQQLHVIESKNRFTMNPDVSLGANKWVDLVRYPGVDDPVHACVQRLRQGGYRIVATMPGRSGHTPDDIPIDRPLAFCFGTELLGLSDELIDQADLSLRIPMQGFTESYNISVSAAIVMYTVMQRLHRSGMDTALDASEQLALKIRWLRASLRDAEAIERRIIGDDATGTDRS